MTASGPNRPLDFFEEHDLDPVTAATGARTSPAPAAPKKKAGFYLPEALLDRFNRCYHQLKLAGAAIENKSALLEMALTFALDDLDKGERSQLKKSIR